MDGPAPPTPLAAWLAATQRDAAAPSAAGTPDPPRRAPRPRLLLAATLPWLAVALLAMPALRGAQSPAGPGASDATASPGVTAPPAPVGMTPELAASAVLAVRGDLPSDQYLDTAVAQGVEHHEGFSLVTVAAAVLDRTRDGWSAARWARYAVPLRQDDQGATPLARPWPLDDAAPTPVRPPLRLVPVDEPAALRAATATITAAGYREVTGLELRRTPQLPVVVVVVLRGRAPGEPAVRDHVLWLDADGTRVLGDGPAGRSADVPVPLPAEHP